jgi:hypothetical protein
MSRVVRTSSKSVAICSNGSFFGIRQSGQFGQLFQIPFKRLRERCLPADAFRLQMFFAQFPKHHLSVEDIGANLHPVIQPKRVGKIVVTKIVFSDKTLMRFQVDQHPQGPQAGDRGGIVEIDAVAHGISPELGDI